MKDYSINIISNRKEARIFFSYIAFLLAALMYSMGRFGLLDLFGIKRQVVAFLLIPIVAISIFLIAGNYKILKHPFFLLPLTYLFVSFLFRWKLVHIGEVGVATMLVGVIISGGYKFAEIILRWVIYITGFFAVLGVIQFVVLYFFFYDDAYLRTTLFINYGDYSGADKIMIKHPLNLLGMVSGGTYHLFGRELARPMSFLSEPSLFLAYFMLPGALALTYKSNMRFWGWPILLFCLMSLSGGIYLSFFFCLLALPFLRSKNRFVYRILPFLFFGVVIFWFASFGFELIEAGIRFVGGIIPFLNKTHSIRGRLVPFLDLFYVAVQNPMGLGISGSVICGMILKSVVVAGVFGLAIIYKVLTNLFTIIGELFQRQELSTTQRLSMVLISGIYIEASIINDYGFASAHGFVLLILAYSRLQYLKIAILNGREKNLSKGCQSSPTRKKIYTW